MTVFVARGGGVNESRVARATLLFFGGIRGYRFGRGTQPRKFVFKVWGIWHRLCSAGGGGGYVSTSAHLHLQSWPRGLLHVHSKFTASSLEVLAPLLSVH